MHRTSWICTNLKTLYAPSEVSPFDAAFIQASIWVGLRLLFETSRANFHKISEKVTAKLGVYVFIEVEEARLNSNYRRNLSVFDRLLGILIFSCMYEKFIFRPLKITIILSSIYFRRGTWILRQKYCDATNSLLHVI